MAGSRGAAEARPRASARTRRPSLKARAQPAECEHASKPQAAGGARRGGRAAAPEGLRLLTPAPRKRPASDGGGGDGGDDTPKTGASRRASSCRRKSGAATQKRASGAASKGAVTTPVGKPRQLELEGSPKPHNALDARGSTARRSTALYSSPLDGRQHGHTRARGHGSWHTHQ